MDFDPLAAVGLVVSTLPGEVPKVSGTCFLFRHDDIALTARHCVIEGEGHTSLHFPRLARRMSVQHVERHSSADIAALYCSENLQGEERSGYPTDAFWDGVANWGLGEEFMAYGFPSEAPSSPIGSSNAAVPRVFVGNFQRFFDYSSPAGFRYLAGELSIPAPGGLSGGPLFRRGAPQMLLGLVTANYESYAITDSIEEVSDDGRHFRLESRKIITYGVALMLSGVADWLHAVIPERKGIGWVL